MSRRILGVLGGMGPEASAYFYTLITKLTKAKKDQDHISMIIYSEPTIPDRTKAFLGKGPSPVPAMIKAIKLLEQNGAHVIAIPCNSAHHWINELKNNTNTKIIDMIEEFTKDVKQLNYKKLGLLATTTTVQSKLYEKYLQQHNIQIILPQNQEQIMQAIYQIKAGKTKRARKTLIKATKELEQKGAQAIIAGCTEIPLALKPKDTKIPLLDPMISLAKKSIIETKGPQALNQKTYKKLWPTK
ncbi:MAG: aspartate/glutamate racemase family protein [Thermoprotei archaeon]